MALLWGRFTGGCLLFGLQECFAQFGCRGSGPNPHETPFGFLAYDLLGPLGVSPGLIRGRSRLAPKFPRAGRVSALFAVSEIPEPRPPLRPPLQIGSRYPPAPVLYSTGLH
jgi:hypothetical protein